MRPICLKMCAFGPYKDLAVIDFEKLGTSGIFLITGDTGSGKTTIFDAISFALFGVASGSIRENFSFRSDFARNDVRTFVELEFEHKGILYKIERVPRYIRKKLRGEGTTIVNGEATLTFLESVITGDKNVTEKSIEILGINAKQFKQIVMIPQGEFLNLLLANSKDRAAIFRRVFDTYIYKDIGELLKNKYLDKKREYEAMVLSLNELEKGIIWNCDNDGDLSHDVVNLLLLEVNRDKILVKDLENKLLNINQDFVLVVEKISEARVINDSLYDLKESRLLLKEMDNKLMEIEKKKDLLSKNRGIFDFILPVEEIVIKLENSILEKKNSLQDNLNKYQSIIDSSNKIVFDYENLDVLEKELNDLEDLKKRREEYLTIFSKIRDINMQLDDQVFLCEKLRYFERKKLIEKFDCINRLRSELNSLEDEFKKLQVEYLDKNSSYVKYYNLFLEEQAGILATNLEDGCPCPVCGSLDHPNLAVVSSDDISKVFLDDLKSELDIVSEELANKSDKINKKKEELIYIFKEVENYSEEDIRVEYNQLADKFEKESLEVDSDFNILDVQREIDKLNFYLDNQLSLVEGVGTEDENKEELNKIDQKICDKEVLINNIKNNYEDFIKNESSLKSVIDLIKRDIEQLENDLEKKKREYVLIYTKFGYKSVDSYKKVQLDKDTFDSFDLEVRNFERDYEKVTSKVSTLEKMLKDKKVIDLSVLERKKIRLEREKSDIELFLKETNVRLSNNLNIYNKINDVSLKLVDLEKEVVVYKDLSDTANGMIKGKNKLGFEQFVQAHYFDSILISANKRFAFMTDNRYKLFRKIESSRISDSLGLELEVMDYYTGKRRNIQTLSGGESFKASLALALGIADVVMSYTGGVLVDVMFIDEGFGSLDEQSLNQAIGSIMSLGQDTRLVGIISHVNELKSMIDKKIVVNKGSFGSSVSVVV